MNRTTIDVRFRLPPFRTSNRSKVSHLKAQSLHNSQTGIKNRRIQVQHKTKATPNQGVAFGLFKNLLLPSLPRRPHSFGSSSHFCSGFWADDTLNGFGSGFDSRFNNSNRFDSGFRCRDGFDRSFGSLYLRPSSFLCRNNSSTTSSTHPALLYRFSRCLDRSLNRSGLGLRSVEFGPAQFLSSFDLG